MDNPIIHQFSYTIHTASASVVWTVRCYSDGTLDAVTGTSAITRACRSFGELADHIREDM